MGYSIPQLFVLLPALYMFGQTFHSGDRIALLVATALFFSPVILSQASPPYNGADYLAHATAGVQTMQTWYNSTTGLWDGLWWNSANSLTTVATLNAISPAFAPTANVVYQHTYSKGVTFKMRGRTKQQLTTQNPNGFINDFYDDEGWWALGWLKVYDVTNNTNHLFEAENIFTDMQAGHDATCGGIWWDKAQTYNAAIANEQYLAISASLANRARQPARKQMYLDTAKQQWTWFKATGLINAQNLINDGLDLTTCKNNGRPTYSYNQGVILGGLVELYRATNDATYLDEAMKIATAAMTYLSAPPGILQDLCEKGTGGCGSDGSQFKGIFMRNLAMLQMARPDDGIKAFILRNADSVWNNDRSPTGNKLGLKWTGPYEDGGDAAEITQASACDALVSAALVS